VEVDRCDQREARLPTDGDDSSSPTLTGIGSRSGGKKWAAQKCGPRKWHHDHTPASTASAWHGRSASANPENSNYLRKSQIWRCDREKFARAIRFLDLQIGSMNWNH